MFDRYNNGSYTVLAIVTAIYLVTGPGKSAIPKETRTPVRGIELGIDTKSVIQNYGLPSRRFYYKESGGRKSWFRIPA